MTEQIKRLLVIVQLKAPTMERIQKVVPLLQEALRKISREPVETAFRSAGSDTFGFFIKTNLRPRGILDRIQAPGHSIIPDQRPFLDGGDSVFALELGSDWSATEGFSRAYTWLQRH
jgi:hypothetical protein